MEWLDKVPNTPHIVVNPALNRAGVILTSYSSLRRARVRFSPSKCHLKKVASFLGRTAVLSTTDTVIIQISELMVCSTNRNNPIHTLDMLLRSIYFPLAVPPWTKTGVRGMVPQTCPSVQVILPPRKFFHHFHFFSNFRVDAGGRHPPSLPLLFHSFGHLFLPLTFLPLPFIPVRLIYTYLPLCHVLLDI